MTDETNYDINNQKTAFSVEENDNHSLENGNHQDDSTENHSTKTEFIEENNPQPLSPEYIESDQQDSNQQSNTFNNNDQSNLLLNDNDTSNIDNHFQTENKSDEPKLAIFIYLFFYRYFIQCEIRFTPMKRSV
jgi:hypothetical protein